LVPETIAIGIGATGAAFNVAHVTTDAIAAIEIACIIRFMTLSFNLKTTC
jgi:hypothetical protein